MKKHFKIFLLLLTTCCYANTVFEFLDNEKEHNFENESHCYVQQATNNNVEFSVNQDIPLADLILNILPQHNFSAYILSLSSRSFIKKNFFPPPNRLYLFHLSLRI